jgi:hypothetical protein
MVGLDPSDGARRDADALQDFAVSQNCKIPLFHHERIRLERALGLGAAICQ